MCALRPFGRDQLNDHPMKCKDNIIPAQSDGYVETRSQCGTSFYNEGVVARRFKLLLYLLHRCCTEGPVCGRLLHLLLVAHSLACIAAGTVSK